MGRRDFQSTVADALPRIIQEQAKNGIGSIRFWKKDKKTVGKLYFRGGSIYAIEVSTYVPNIVNRIATNEYISQANREQLLNKFQDDITNPEAINYVLTYQMFPEKPLMTYIKDYFLDAFDLLYSWDSVNAEWRTNDEPPKTVPTVPNANPFELIEKLEKRKSFLEEEVAPLWNTAPVNMGSLGFRRTVDYTDPDYITNVILSLGDGKWTIGGVAEYLGLSHFNTKIVIYDLWREGVVDILHPSGLVITYRDPETLHQSEHNPNPTAEELPAIEAELLSPESAEEETVAAQPEEPVAAPDTTIEVAESTPVEEPVKDEEPVSIPQEDVSEVISLIEEIDAPITPAQPASITPPVSEAEPEELISLETNHVVLPPVEPTPATTTKESEVMSDPTPTGSNPSTASRLRAIAAQLQQELRDLQNTIQSVHQSQVAKETYVNSLKAERQALVDKIRLMDTNIANETQSLEAIKTELSQLQAEYNESISFTKDIKY